MTPEDIAKLPYRPCVGVMVCNGLVMCLRASGSITIAMRGRCLKVAWKRGEDPRDAALRELEEETGIPANAVEVVAETEDWIPYDLPRTLVPKLWKGRFRGQEQKWFLLRFSGDDSLINIETDEPEFREWCWIKPEELLGMIVPFKRDTYERVIREFKDQMK